MICDEAILNAYIQGKNVISESESTCLMPYHYDMYDGPEGYKEFFMTGLSESMGVTAKPKIWKQIKKAKENMKNAPSKDTFSQEERDYVRRYDKGYEQGKLDQPDFKTKYKKTDDKVYNAGYYNGWWGKDKKNLTVPEIVVQARLFKEKYSMNIYDDYQESKPQNKDMAKGEIQKPTFTLGGNKKPSELEEMKFRHQALRGWVAEQVSPEELDVLDKYIDNLWEAEQ